MAPVEDVLVAPAISWAREGDDELRLVTGRRMVVSVSSFPSWVGRTQGRSGGGVGELRVEDGDVGTAVDGDDDSVVLRAQRGDDDAEEDTANSMVVSALEFAAGNGGNSRTKTRPRR